MDISITINADPAAIMFCAAMMTIPVIMSYTSGAMWAFVHTVRGGRS